MKKYNFIKITLCASILTFCVACTGNFEDYNSHPYNPTMKDLTPAAQISSLMEEMLYQMHHQQENDSQMIDQMVGCQYGGYVATPTLWGGFNYSTYNQSDGWNQDCFNTPFNKFYSNWTKLKDVTEGKGYIFAWANVVRVAAMLRITDTYGPIPYSQLGQGKFNVAYDSEETVYKNMIADLENSARTLAIFAAENKGKELAMASSDIVFKGDFDKWVLFANSLRLRLAIRMSNILPDYAKTVGEAAVAAGVITSNSNNVFLPTVDNPYRKSANAWGDLRLNANVDSYLSGYNDPRYAYYSTGPRGIRMGVNVTASSKADYAGYAQPNVAENSPLPVMNAAEVAFLKAEGVLKGWNMGGGTVQSLYEEGIKLSMAQYPAIGAANITAYINDNTRKPAAYTGPTAETNINALGTLTVKWDESATTEVKLERIITQKWIANFMIGFESWSEYRRTGYPKLFPTVNNLSNGVVDGARGARRLKFPASEYRGNLANVQAAVQMIGGSDSPAVDLWWAKKN